ncbi:MAG: DUF4091 domain-containing protein, partial [Anaerolineae bacterium]|nr:DUF4091 domain-containing protein [Anaerolineae bacterium]
PVRHHNLPLDQVSLEIDGRGHIPGYGPDPLYDDEDSLMLPPNETHAFWTSAQPGAEVEPGLHQIAVQAALEGEEPVVRTIDVMVHDVQLRPREGFHITHWFYCDALIDWYRTKQFDARFWDLLPRYMRNVAEHGLDTLYVPVFTPPLDGVKTPSQLLCVTCDGPDSYRFDWQDVRRYVRLARECGLTHFEWCHLFTQWGARYAIRIYEGQGQDERLLWPAETAATSDTYRRFLAQYLPELRRFLEEEGLLDSSFFHISDEPHGPEHLQQYRQNRAMLRELAPWMPVMDALTEIEFARQGLMDRPIPSIRTALDFVAEGIPCWCYYCCGPRGAYLNRLLDTALPKIAMHGLLFYRWPLQGFLHWGYNYWYQSQTRQLIDPYNVQDGLKWERGWAYGDPFMVYPGPDGPVDSMRWEIFAESLQDYALLQMAEVSRDDPLLAPIQAFDDFPVHAAWRQAVRHELLQRATKA